MTSTKQSAWPGVGETPRYERCEQCGAAMDQQQRYCVQCAARRKDVPNPATTFFAGSARRARHVTVAETPQPQREGSGGRALAVALFALLPIAVALGVLAGRSGSDGTDNQALIDALRKQEATAGTTAGSSTANASLQALTSDFSLQKGFTVKLETLPYDSTDQAAAAKAKKAATAKGAKDVGIINPSDFTLTPDQGTDYVLYSGEFKSKGEAEKALRGLKGKFKSAEVVAVKSSATAGGGKVVANTDHGTIHQVTGFKATPEKTAQDTQTVQDIANATGKSYVDKQKELPDVMVIGEGGKTSTPAPTGAGD